MAEKLKTIRIDRAKWLTPDTAQNEDECYDDVTALYNGGKMCCLGFASQQISEVPKKHFDNVPMPQEVGEVWLERKHPGSHVGEASVDLIKGIVRVRGEVIKLPKWLRNPLFWREYSVSETPPTKIWSRRKFIEDAARVNDDMELKPRAREAAVRRIFAKIGWRAVFHGKYPTKKKTLPPVS